MKAAMSGKQLLERIITSAANACAARDAYHDARLRAERLDHRAESLPARLYEHELGAVAVALVELAAAGAGQPDFVAEKVIDFRSAEAGEGAAGYERRIRAALAG